MRHVLIVLVCGAILQVAEKSQPALAGRLTAGAGLEPVVHLAAWQNAAQGTPRAAARLSALARGSMAVRSHESSTPGTRPWPNAQVTLLSASASQAAAHAAASQVTPSPAVRWTPQVSRVTARFRGVSAVSATVAWASGSNGTIVRTVDGGRMWQVLPVPGAESLDFRDIDAIDERVAYTLSIGPGEASRIFKTVDAGQHWETQFINRDPKAFFDAMAFWNADHGIVMSDSVDGAFVILLTRDGGRTWTRAPQSGLPPALPNEGAFAASGTNVAVYFGTMAASGDTASRSSRSAQSSRSSRSGSSRQSDTRAAASAPASELAEHGQSAETGAEHVWIGTGAATTARVLRSHDGGRTWAVSNTPLPAGPSAGIFSITFRDPLHGTIVGGDYKKEGEAVDNVAITSDGGATWTLVPPQPRAVPPASAPSAGPTAAGAGNVGSGSASASAAGPAPRTAGGFMPANVGGLSGFRSVVAYVPSPTLSGAAPLKRAPGASSSLIAIGPSGADYSTDDGHTWRPVECAGFHAFSFAPRTTVGWAVGEKGRIARLDILPSPDAPGRR